MKILKIKLLEGYKMLSKDFEISFLTKTRVDKNADNDDLVELEKDFYYPLETVFVGKNSSGKTTTLELIQLIFDFLKNGRIPNGFLNEGEKFSFETIFYDGGYLYKYEGKFTQDIDKSKPFLIIEEESLGKTTIKESHKKDLSNVSFFLVKEFIKNIGGDTSGISKVPFERELNFSVDNLADQTSLFAFYHSVLGDETFNTLIHLFDDSVDFIKPYMENGKVTEAFEFKRKDHPVKLVDGSYLSKNLSKGTIRGINLYGMSILTFKVGGTIIVDEIEKSFNRNLIENLLLMFNDAKINIKHASIIYSTHYSEILDVSERCDNVNVLHRDGNIITLKNMCTDYSFRTGMLKSNSFNQNAFDNLLNYNRLMDLKDLLRG